MQIINLEIPRWSLVESLDQIEILDHQIDIASLADDISQANYFDLCDLNLHEYTH
jgi:hypothetical protein